MLAAVTTAEHENGRAAAPAAPAPRRARAASPRAPRRSWRPRRSWPAPPGRRRRARPARRPSGPTAGAATTEGPETRAERIPGPDAVPRSRASWCAMRRPRARPRSTRGRRRSRCRARACSRARRAASPMRLIAEIGSAWRASPRKPAPWSCGSNTRCAAIRIPITGPREPNSAARPTARAAPTMPEANVIAAACDDVAGARLRGAVGERERRGDVEGERDREDRADDDPGAADPREEQRAARAAGGGQVAEDARVDVLRSRRSSRRSRP